MAIFDTIQKARSAGANSQQIVGEITKANPKISDSVTKALGAGANHDQIIEQIINQNFKAPQSAPEPTLVDRVSGDLKSAGANIVDKAQATGEFATQSLPRRVAGIASDISGAPIKALGETLPQPIRDVADSVGSKVGGVIDWLGEKIGGTQIAQDFVTRHPEAAKFLEEAVGTASGLSSAAANVAGVASAPSVLKTAGTTAVKAFGSVAEGVKPSLASAGKSASGAASSIKGRLSGTSLSSAKKITAPVLNKQEAITTMKRSGYETKPTVKDGITTHGKPSGPATGGLRRIIDTNSLKDERVAKSVKDVVSPWKNAVQNITAINKKIQVTAEKEVKPFLNSSRTTFFDSERKSMLKKVHDNIPEGIKSEVGYENTYSGVGRVLESELAKAGANPAGWWEGLKAFKNRVEVEFPNLYNAEKNQVIRRAVEDYTQAVYKKIASAVPNGDKEFMEKIKHISNMSVARDNIAESSYRLAQKKTTGLQRAAENHPGITGAIKKGAYLAAGYVAGKETGFIH